MNKPYNVPAPKIAKDADELKQRAGLYQFPSFGPMTEHQRNEWVVAKACELVEKSPLADRDLAWDLSAQCAMTMMMSGLAFESVISAKSPRAHEIVKASNIQSKIPRFLRGLGIKVSFATQGGSSAAVADADPFGED